MSEYVENLKISFKKSNFGLYHPNNPFIELFQETILRNPEALYNWRNLEKFENWQKKMQFYLLNWSKFRTSSRKQYERAKTPVPFIFLT